MKKLPRLLKSQKGESLMESIVSILLFTVLAAAVTMLLMGALRVTARALGEAEQRQNAANAIVTRDVTAATVTTETIQWEVTIYWDEDCDGYDLGTINRGIQVYSAEGMRGFVPIVPVVGGP